MSVSEEERERFVEMLHENERLELDKVKQKTVETFGPNIGPAFFEFSHAGKIERLEGYPENFDWKGRREVFARAIITAIETGTSEEKFQAVNSILKAIEVRDSYMRTNIIDF